MSLILMRLTLALSWIGPLAAEPVTCNMQGYAGVSGVSLNQIVRSIEADQPPARRRSHRLLSTGATIDPRQKLKRVPALLVRALPQYRGYDYFVSKAYVVIVHPPTRRIVYLLPFCPETNFSSLG